MRTEGGGRKGENKKTEMHVVDRVCNTPSSGHVNHFSRADEQHISNVTKRFQNCKAGDASESVLKAKTNTPQQTCNAAHASDVGFCVTAFLRFTPYTAVVPPIPAYQEKRPPITMTTTPTTIIIGELCKTVPKDDHLDRHPQIL